MAGTHGGYREPRNPAPASGPGRLSRRTDGGPAQKIEHYTDQPYGQGEATIAQQQGAAMSQQNAIPGLSVPSGGTQPGDGTSNSAVIPFDAPSQRPDEPITHGVDIGPGAGSEILARQDSQSDPFISSSLSQLSAADTTGVLASLLTLAQQRRA